MVRLFVGGLPADVSSKDLYSRFSPFGSVLSVEVVPEKTPLASSTQTQAPVCRGFAFVDVDFKDKAALSKCLSAYNGCKWRGHMLKVEHAKEHYLLKLQREWEASADAESVIGKGLVDAAAAAGPSNASKADELNTQLGQLRLVHSHHRSKIVQVELGDRSKVRTLFPPPKPLPLAALSWEPISNHSSSMYRQQAADEAAERLAARRKRAAAAAAAAAAEAVAAAADDANQSDVAHNDQATRKAEPASRAAAGPSCQPPHQVSRPIRVVCFDSDDEAAGAAAAGRAGVADMDLDRFASDSDEGPTRPAAQQPVAAAVIATTAPEALSLHAARHVPLLPGKKSGKASRRRASSEHDLVLQRQAMKALQRLGRLGRDMDMDEAGTGERVLSMAISQSSSSSSDGEGLSSSGNLPDDDSTDQEQADEQDDLEEDIGIPFHSTHGTSTSAQVNILSVVTTMEVAATGPTHKLGPWRHTEPFASHIPGPSQLPLSQPQSPEHHALQAAYAETFAPDFPTAGPSSAPQPSSLGMNEPGLNEPGTNEPGMNEPMKTAKLSQSTNKGKTRRKGGAADYRPYDADASGDEAAAHHHGDLPGVGPAVPPRFSGGWWGSDSEVVEAAHNSHRDARAALLPLMHTSDDALPGGTLLRAGSAMPTEPGSMLCDNQAEGAPTDGLHGQWALQTGLGRSTLMQEDDVMRPASATGSDDALAGMPPPPGPFPFLKSPYSALSRTLGHVAPNPSAPFADLPSTKTIAALDLASLLGDKPRDVGPMLGLGRSMFGSSESVLASARMGRSRSGGSVGREGRDLLLQGLQMGQQFMRSGSEEELRSNWQAQREGLAADYKRKRRAAMKASSMMGSHKAQRRK